MKKIIAVIAVTLCFAGCAFAERVKYEYKIVPLGSLTSLQKSKGAASKTAEVEGLLNEKGLEGWEIAEIFAVRTTFDPNVFFAVMKRPVE
ncbi:MAG: DUF4177 domain-containing protein [Synergistaceae bacterium]|nr:DUF4177 domain-containing protein [Synergistaceae bacterium]MBR0279841.1 DUF4177 domain-containing protein [Synergistaceae bacterium]